MYHLNSIVSILSSILTLSSPFMDKENHLLASALGRFYALHEPVERNSPYLLIMGSWPQGPFFCQCLRTSKARLRLMKVVVVRLMLPLGSSIRRPGKGFHTMYLGYRVVAQRRQCK